MLSRSRKVSPETVSVSPYASANQADGNVRWIRSMSGMGIFSPPLTISRTDDRSLPSMSGRAMIALTMAGASHTVVTRDRSSSSTTAAASNDRWMITVAPVAMSDVVVRSRAPTWYSGPQASPRSAVVKPNSMMWAMFFHARLAWVIMTPLGRPVVPDVYMRRCTSSALTTARTTPSGDPRRSSNAIHPSGAVDDTHARTNDASMPSVASLPRPTSAASPTRTRAREWSRMYRTSGAASLQLIGMAMA